MDWKVTFGQTVWNGVKLAWPRKPASREATHSYRRLGHINGTKVDVLLDTGSHQTLVKASVTSKCGLQVRTVRRLLFGLGSVSVLSVNTKGKATGGDYSGLCKPWVRLMLVVSDSVRVPDVIANGSLPQGK